MDSRTRVPSSFEKCNWLNCKTVFSKNPISQWNPSCIKEREEMRTCAKKDVVRVLAEDGEVHFVLREHMATERIQECLCLKDDQVAAFFKKEASKPLLLMRAEWESRKSVIRNEFRYLTRYCDYTCSLEWRASEGMSRFTVFEKH